MNKRSPGKSILANFGAFADVKSGRPVESSEGDAATAPAKLVDRVGAGVVGATHRSLSDLREQRDRLQAVVDAGGSIELKPEVVDPSPFPDRLEDDSKVPFQQFKQLIADKGQQVPIQVRKHPHAEGRYQIVYGHRRWRAATELGIPLKAIVLELSDTDLVVAQGIENGARQDLTWIEKALFAATMDAAGIKTRDIRAALSIDDAELAKMRSVCKALPSELIAVIGRAPKVGRPRWLELSAAVARRADAEDVIRKTLSDDKVSILASDGRFRAVLSSLKSDSGEAAPAVELKRPDGTSFGKAVFEPNGVRVSVNKGQEGGFASFMERALPDLVDRYFAENGDG